MSSITNRHSNQISLNEFDNKPWMKRTIVCESIIIYCIDCSVLWSSTHGGWENDEEVDGKM
jgi:hypothetical protein